MSVVEFLASVNGVAQLYASDNQFLGVLSSNRYDVNSISNPHGIYGGVHGLYSISNPHGIYGGVHGLHSPYNSYCLNPPVVIYEGQPVLMTTRNPYAQTYGLPVVDPDLLIEVYAQISNPAPAYCVGRTYYEMSMNSTIALFNAFQ